jgi:hypothetical protein
VSRNDKNLSESVKTGDGTVDDPVSAGSPHPNPTAERLDEQFHTRFQPTAITRENASETMSSYLTLIAIIILVLSPVLVPLAITGAHTVGDWRRKPEPIRPIINAERRAAELV